MVTLTLLDDLEGVYIEASFPEHVAVSPAFARAHLRPRTEDLIEIETPNGRAIYRLEATGRLLRPLEARRVYEELW